mmetsp:Transcript_78118/g.187338  ORF Transcript_78118/g.187338 Transcript_78118/m.187338 type:complete len:366 (-) Transcript_78118:3-1100(-)
MVHGKNTCQDGPRDAAHAMQAHGIQCVVDGHPVEDRNAEVAPRASDGAESHATAGRHIARTWGDADQADHRPNRSAHAGGLSFHHPLHDDPAQHRGCSGCEGGSHSPWCEAILGAQSRSTGEAQPAKPHQGCAQEDEGHIGGAQFLGRIAPRANDGAGHIAGNTGADVDHGAPGKVESAQSANPAVGSPNPMAKRGVDEDGPKSEHYDVRIEVHALDEGARDNRRGQDRKSHLEAGVAQPGQVCSLPHAHVQVHQEDIVQISDEGTISAKGQGKANGHPYHRHDAHGHEAHHHRVDDVGVSDEAAVKKAEPRGHDKDQSSGGQHPCNRASADEFFREFDGHHRSKLLTTEQTLRQPKEPLSAVTA